jgi:hypothetical protein
MTAVPEIRTVIRDGDEPLSAGIVRRAAVAAAAHGATMGLYVIERNFAEQLDPDELDYAGIELVNDDVGVRWLYSFLSADRKKTYCLYEAPSEDAIREAAVRNGVPADVIIPVQQIGPQPVS